MTAPTHAPHPARAPRDKAALAAFVDHTLLKPEATAADVAALVEEGVGSACYSVCVSPSFVSLAVEVAAGARRRDGVRLPVGQAPQRRQGRRGRPRRRRRRRRGRHGDRRRRRARRPVRRRRGRHRRGPRRRARRRGPQGHHRVGRAHRRRRSSASAGRPRPPAPTSSRRPRASTRPAARRVHAVALMAATVGGRARRQGVRRHPDARPTRSR